MLTTQPIQAQRKLLDNSQIELSIQNVFFLKVAMPTDHHLFLLTKFDNALIADLFSRVGSLLNGRMIEA